MDNHTENEVKNEMDSMAPMMAPEELLPTETKKPKKRISLRAGVGGALVALVVIAVVLFIVFYKNIFVAASVNGSNISRQTVIKELERVSGKSALESLITEKLINDEAAKKNVTVSNDEVQAEIKKVEDQLTAQGSTLDQALTAQGMTRADFEKQVLIQKKLEKMLADKTQVTDEEIQKYITDNKVTVPAGQEVTYKAQIGEQIRQQKLSTAASELVSSLRAAASIKYYVSY